MASSGPDLHWSWLSKAASRRGEGRVVTQPGFFWPRRSDCDASTDGPTMARGQHGWTPHGALSTCTSPYSVSPPIQAPPTDTEPPAVPNASSTHQESDKNILGLGVFILFSCLKRYISVCRHNLITFPIFMKLPFSL